MADPNTKNSPKKTVPVTGSPRAGDEPADPLLSTFLWRIENVSAWEIDYHGKEITSPEFEFFNMGGAVWRIGVFPAGEKIADETFFLRIFMVSGDRSVTFDGMWSLLDGDGRTILTKRFGESVLSEGLSLHFADGLAGQEKETIFATGTFLSNDSLRVELRFWKNQGEFEIAEHLSALSRIQFLDLTLEWSIENFEGFQLGEERSIEIGPELDLVLSLCGTSLDDACLEFQVLSVAESHQSLKVNIFVQDRNGESARLSEERHFLSSTAHMQTWVLPSYVTRREILERRSTYIRDGGDLVLICNCKSTLREILQSIVYSYFGPVNPDIVSLRTKFKSDLKENRVVIAREKRKSPGPAPRPSMSQTKCNSLAVLGEDLLSLYQSNQLTDYEVRCGDVSIPVHKNILSARSEVFRDAICSNPDYHVSNLDVKILRLMLTFLYSGTLEVLEFSSAVDLYCAGREYKVPTLRVACLEVLKSCLAVSNVSVVLELAYCHQDGDLTSFVHDYIVNNYDEVVLSKEWSEFLDNSLLGGKTMQEIHRKQLESGRFIKMRRKADGPHFA